MAEVVGRLNELAEKGETLSRRGQIRWGSGKDELRGDYGFTVRVGLPGEPDGEPSPPRETKPARPTPRDFPFDLFDEDDHYLVVGELPGTEREDVRVDARERAVSISAGPGEDSRREVALPGPIDPRSVTVDLNNGVMVIRCGKTTS
jgi:HSP20 family protein